MSLKELNINNKTYRIPQFLPDATRGVVKSIDSLDIKNTGTNGMVVNTLHLFTNPGLNTLQKAGGLKNLMSWEGFIASDSGGFQVLSLLYRKKLKGTITKNGPVFYITDKSGTKEKVALTPEKAIEIQFKIGADIMICLDDDYPEGSEEKIKESVKNTINWAKRCKEEYLKTNKLKNRETKEWPLLFAVIQGGFDKKLRKYCADELIKIGFDGYGSGGWVIDKKGNLDYEMMEYIAKLTPDDKFRFALGVGKLADLVACTQMGYHIFDCVLPTRDARHKRLYLFGDQGGDSGWSRIGLPAQAGMVPDWKDTKEFNNWCEKTFGYLYIDKTKYKEDFIPVSNNCDCFTCKNYTRAYLYHLFKVEDPLAWRLSTIHNLRTYQRVIELLQKWRARQDSPAKRD